MISLSGRGTHTSECMRVSRTLTQRDNPQQRAVMRFDSSHIRTLVYPRHTVIENVGGYIHARCNVHPRRYGPEVPGSRPPTKLELTESAWRSLWRFRTLVRDVNSACDATSS